MHLTPSWVHVRFTDPYGLFATDSDEHYDSLCDMGSDVRFLRMVSFLVLLLLPLATQVCGKRVFGMTEGIDVARRRGGILQADSVL